VIAIQDKTYKIGELAFEYLDKKFELHLTFTHECFLAMQGQYGFQAYLEMYLDGGKIHKVTIIRLLIQAQEDHFWGHHSAITIIECKKIMWFIIRLYYSMLS
jgi:hypothetical protein